MSTRRGTSTQVASSVPFDNTSNSYNSTNLQTLPIELRNQQLLEQQVTTTSNNGNLNLTLNSNTLQVLVGTGTNYSLNLPNATTVNEGFFYDVWNYSSQAVNIKDAGGNILALLRANGRTQILLRGNSSSNGLWGVTYTLDNGNVFGGEVNYVEANAETSTSSTTVWLNKLTLTTPSDLPLGDYLASFQFIWRSSTANREADFRFRLNSVDQVTWSPSTGRTQDRQLLSGFFRVQAISGTNTFTFDFKKEPATSSTIFVSQARMFVWRIA
jgi:hypothetical protein